MKKIIAVATLLLLGTISLFAQKSVAEQINDYKMRKMLSFVKSKTM